MCLRLRTVCVRGSDNLGAEAKDYQFYFLSRDGARLAEDAEQNTQVGTIANALGQVFYRQLVTEVPYKVCR